MSSDLWPGVSMTGHDDSPVVSIELKKEQLLAFDLIDQPFAAPFVVSGGVLHVRNSHSENFPHLPVFSG